MKRILKLIPAFLFVLVYACDNEQAIPSYPLSSTYPIQSRGDGDVTSLPTGSQILLNANGGLLVENGIFTYNGSTWSNGQDLQWTDTPTETIVTALYPIYEGNDYTLDHLYSNGRLEDLLIAQDTLSKKGDINLQFKHLFSSLTLYFEPTLATYLQTLALSVPVQIEKVTPQDGTYSLSPHSHTILQNNNGSDAYTFILPPCEECTLSLLLTLTDGTSHEVNFSPHTFQSGLHYACNISQYDSRPGIRDAEDLIAFSQLINGTYKGEETLDSFSETVDEQRVYRLLADITLTEEECNRLSPIGASSNTAFSDVFDGEGHTLSNLILPDQKYSGLFGHVASTGIIQNLHLNQASIVDDAGSSQYVGVVVANNNGIIDNCSVTHSTVSSIEKGFLGLICGLSSGTILNCYTQNDTIHVSNGSTIGAIVSSSSKNILNCYSSKNSFSTKGSTYKIGSIAGACATLKSLNIENCYIYHNQSTKNWGAALGVAPLATIQNFYYNKGEVCYNPNATTTTSNTLVYNSSYCIDSIHISQLLNEWIQTTGATAFPNYTFNQWKISTDGSACFK